MLNGMKIKLYKVGSCKHPEIIIKRDGSWCCHDFPMIVALIQHPVCGYVLFDTGYSAEFFNITNKFPEKLYRLVTPVKLTENDTLKSQLKADGINLDSIRTVIISHFHADHISGLKELTNAKFICSREGYLEIKNKNSLCGLKKGLIKKFLPGDFELRVEFIEDKPKHKTDMPFENVWDIFGDESCLAVELPGHSKGHTGLLCPDSNIFLIGDACWTEKAITDYKWPSALAYLIMDNKNHYKKTLRKIIAFKKTNPQVEIIPSHCDATFQRCNHEK